MDKAEQLFEKIAIAVTDKADQKGIRNYLLKQNKDGSVNKYFRGSKSRNDTFWNGVVPNVAGTVAGLHLSRKGHNLATALVPTVLGGVLQDIADKRYNKKNGVNKSTYFGRALDVTPELMNDYKKYKNSQNKNG